MGGGGGSWLGYPPPQKKIFGKIFPPFRRVTLWQIPPLKSEKTLYSPPKIGQFFGFPPKTRASRIDSGNRVLGSKVGNRNRNLELLDSTIPERCFSREDAQIWRQKACFSVNHMFYVKFAPKMLLFL